MSKKYIIIKADTNDADYITSKHEINDEDLELIKPLIQAIKDYENDKSIKHQKWNWDVEGNNDQTPEDRYGELVSEDAFDLFRDLCPSGEDPIHSIASIELLEVINETKLL